MTKREAVERFVGQMQQIPGALIRAAYRDEERWDSFELLAGGTAMCPECGAELDLQPEGDSCEYECTACQAWCGDDKDALHEPVLAWPAGWDTLFHPSWPDDEWVRENLEAVAACGFLVYDCQYCGILLAIDRAGYDFYAHHWTPLYEARGLRWHEHG